MVTHQLFEAPQGTAPPQFKKRLLHRPRALPKDVRTLERKETKPAAIDEVQDILEALHRCREGTYALCGACGHEISMSRLKANPYTKLCLRCKKAEEAL